MAASATQGGGAGPLRLHVGIGEKQQGPGWLVRSAPAPWVDAAPHDPERA